MGMLHTLELENFKSYRGKKLIGPFSKFTAIIGPNGSGKSNLMDAISFVLGEKTRSLRVKKLSDLIHGAPVGEPVATRCSVTLNYKENDGRIRSFSRIVHNATNEFRLDGKVIQQEEYNQEMEKIQIFINAKNFLVYQGAIESIAMKTPKERTALFEEISRSCEYKAEYDRLKAEMSIAEAAIHHNMDKKRGIAQEKRAAKLERDEAEKYQVMRDELAAKQRQLYMLELYHCERLAKEAEEELEKKSDQVETLQQKKNEADDVVTSKQKALKKTLRGGQKQDKELADKEKEIAVQRPIYVQAKQEVLHWKSKIDTANKALNAVQRQAEKTEEIIKNLEKQSKDLEQKKKDCEAELQSQSQEMDLNLSDVQIEEYKSLRMVANKRAGMIDMQLNSLKQEHENDASARLHEQRRLTTWTDKIKTKEQEIERYRKQIDHLAETAEQQKSLLADERDGLVRLEHEVKTSKEKLDKVTNELTEVNRQLGDASGDTGETERNRKRNEAIDSLKRVFPDKVYGRLVDLCQPSHKRFNLAVTKILQKHMMSIVCDTVETAREAIVYLKEQRLAPETFLPSDGIDVQPISEKLRGINHPQGVKLVYDVVQCNSPVARKALQFACRNALLCNDAEDAKFIAFGGLPGGERHKTVALDGTMFQTSGLISGGATELMQRARKWDENALRKLREKRNELVNLSNELHKTRRKELDVESQRNKLSSLESRLKITINDKQRMEMETMDRSRHELESFKAELAVIQPRIHDVEEMMSEREKQIKKLEAQSNAVTDEVFGSFCTKIGIRNIRQYEERELRFHQERIDRLREFDNDLDRIKNEIEYHRSEDKTKRAQKEAEKLKKMDKDLEVLRKKESKEAKVLNGLETDMETMKVAGLDRKVELEKLEAAVAIAKNEARNAAHDVTVAEKAEMGLQSIIKRKRYERHSLLKAVKINQMNIPLSAGSFAEVESDDDDEMDGAQTSPSQLSQEQMEREALIKINYRSLPGVYKDIEYEDDVHEYVEKMNKDIADTQTQLSRFIVPNLRANQRMEQVKEREGDVTEEYDMARKKARNIRAQFERTKADRYRKFSECFEHVSQKIDEIYKALSRNASAQAFLGADNTEEPYLEGIQYNCVAPGKRFRPMDNLSGGEKTVAALALLFAVHARNPSPFFVLDEIDAALDNTNIGKVASFICDSARSDMQIIVISLKEEFYNKADTLVGIYPEPASCTVSGILAIDLTAYKQTVLNETTATENRQRQIAADFARWKIQNA